MLVLALMAWIPAGVVAADQVEKQFPREDPTHPGRLLRRMPRQRDEERGPDASTSSRRIGPDADRELWWAVLKNVRAGIMPPAGKPRPSDAERRLLEDWIKYGAFGIEPKNSDPGRVTVRRLNRVEYRNTIRELMGVDYDTNVEFPPDDSGHGFDNIADVLTVSPMLLEKYLAAAKSIVSQVVPMVPRVAKIDGDED